MTNSTGTNAVAGVSDVDLQYLIDVTQHRPKYHSAFKELQSLRSRLSCIEAGPGEVADLLKGVADALGYAEWPSPRGAEEVLQEIIDTWWPKLSAALSPIGVEAPANWTECCNMAPEGCDCANPKHIRVSFAPSPIGVEAEPVAQKPTAWMDEWGELSYSKPTYGPIPLYALANQGGGK